MLYISIVIIIVCLSFHYDYQRHLKGRRECYIGLCIIFILIAGLRYRLGIDTIAYEYMYSSFPSLNSFFEFDFDSLRYGRGFLFIVALCKSISCDYILFQIVHAIIINSISFYFFYKYSKNIFFSILLYFFICFFPYNFEVLRESCAVVILLFGWKYFLSNSWIKYYSLSIIAYLFHPSGIIMFILPIFYLPIFKPFFTIGKYQIGISIILFFILGSLNIFEFMKIFEVDTLQKYADLYEQSDYAESLKLNILGIIDVGIRYFIYPILAVIVVRSNSLKRNKQESDKNFLKKVEYMVCWYIYIAVLSLAIRIFYRFNNYFAPF